MAERKDALFSEGDEDVTLPEALIDCFDRARPHSGGHISTSRNDAATGPAPSMPAPRPPDRRLVRPGRGSWVSRPRARHR